MYASNQDVHNEDWVLVTDTSLMSQAAINLTNSSVESSIISSTPLLPAISSSSDIPTPTSLSSKASRSLSLASISSTEFDHNAIDDEQLNTSDNNESTAIDSDLTLLDTHDESNTDETETSLAEITPIHDKNNSNSVISNSTNISDIGLSDAPSSLTPDNDNQSSCMSLDISNAYSHQSSPLFVHSTDLLSQNNDDVNNENINLNTVNECHQDDQNNINIISINPINNTNKEQENTDSTLKSSILSSSLQLNNLSSVSDVQLLIDLLSQHSSNLSNDSATFIREDEDSGSLASIALSSELRRRTGPHVRQTSVRFDDDLDCEEKLLIDKQTTESDTDSSVTLDKQTIVDEHDVQLTDVNATKTASLASDAEVEASLNYYREISNTSHYNSTRHESSRHMNISLDLLVLFALVLVFFLGIGYLNGSYRTSHITKKLADAEEKINVFETNEKLRMSEVSQKVSKMYNEKVNNMIIRDLRDQLEKHDNEKTKLLNHIEHLRFMLNLTQMNLTKSIDMLREDHDQLINDMKLLQERMNRTEKQYEQCMVKKNSSSSSKCVGVDCNIKDDLNKSIFEQILQKTSTIIDLNNDTILSNVVSSLNSFVDKRQQYVDDFKLKVQQFNSDHGENIRTTLTNIKEDLTSSIQQVHTSCSDWLFSRAHQREQSRTESDELQDQQQRKSWRWTFQRGTLREQERLSSWKNTSPPSSQRSTEKQEQERSSFNRGSRTMHRSNNKFRYPSTNLCWMKKWMTIIIDDGDTFEHDDRYKILILSPEVQQAIDQSENLNNFLQKLFLKVLTKSEIILKVVLTTHDLPKVFVENYLHFMNDTDVGPFQKVLKMKVTDRNYCYLVLVLCFLKIFCFDIMNEESFKLAERLVPCSYIQLARQARRTREQQIRQIIEHRKLPEIGLDDSLIEQWLNELSQMDSNNFLGNIGVGEREGRVYSSLVAKRHYSFSHGIGRSGDINSVQPKAAGSSLLNQLTNELVLDTVKYLGLRTIKSALVIPMATGMTLTLCLLTLKKIRPQCRYVLWSRIDQKSCLKAILATDLIPVIIEQIQTDDNEELHTDVNKFEQYLKNCTNLNEICCIYSTTSCFAPRAIDNVVELSLLCEKYSIPHLINNAYGLQSTKIIHELEQSKRKGGRIDYIVQSTDKNFLVPVGGSIVLGYDQESLDRLSKIYPGRASITPTIDLFITLLSMGRRGLTDLIQKRKLLHKQFLDKLIRWTSENTEHILKTKQNPISIAVTLTQLPSEHITQLGSMLFSRRISGARVIQIGKKQTIDNYEFENYGSHSSTSKYSYLTVAASIGIQEEHIDLFIKKFDILYKKVLLMSTNQTLNDLNIVDNSDNDVMSKRAVENNIVNSEDDDDENNNSNSFFNNSSVST
ncbi:unnamed protein product [Didymodactylos carnosus]|uniref:O-phosphoseryl-tRNA(Sec) selenium transferase n=1 Tax=Didymodactylos carnosus TaxID=1234261 RepID=A0A8S2CY51_9BILA|nr:unnamed protein product [Didymodactylos carnosus]CAF3546718.1 unnamed protein product [Didymodactylos carnosus]